MAALYGRMRGYSKGNSPVQKNEQTAIGHGSIVAKLETWHGSILVELEADGSFQVRTGSKSGPNDLALEGQIDA